MSVAIITGSGGLVGAAAVTHYAKQGFDVVGIDCDMRKEFFGDSASTEWNVSRIKEEHSSYTHFSDDIRDRDALEKIFSKYSKDIKLIIHAAAQPSHDWAAKDPITDFEVNALGTMNLLEATRKHSPDAVFIFTSTNKVYGDNPNQLPLIEEDDRWEVSPDHPFREHGIDESMSVDYCLHSLFGVSKLSADAMVQEYSRYFGLKSGIFRAGCITGPMHSGAELHGFLSYLVKCVMTGTKYNIYGYKGKQVRDNISAYDLVQAFDSFFKNPQSGEVYNMGGGRGNSCSVLEAFATTSKICGKESITEYVDDARVGDHIWYISDLRKFQNDYPDWKIEKTLDILIQEISDAWTGRI